jgi:chromosome segregation ATPase
MLQPRSAAASASAGRAAAPTAKRAESGRGQPLNASVAESMASKLSDTELAAIISMTDKLSKMDKEVNLLRNDKEALTAKLDGTEAVKQFLIGKVRDVELKLNQSKEEEVKVTQQIASDQEVIAFLDSRVQELERLSENVKQEKTTVQKGLESLKVTSSKKITMLSDMLKYEREKLKDEEAEWKATKKVLVKEVKSCRAQLLALQAERDGYKEQNEMLKRAIVSTGKSAAASPSRS